MLRSPVTLLAAAISMGGASCSDKTDALDELPSEDGGADVGSPALDSGGVGPDAGPAPGDGGPAPRDGGPAPRDGGPAPRDGGPVVPPRCSGVARVDIYSPDGLEHAVGGFSVAAVPGFAGLFAESSVVVFDAATDAPPIQAPLDGVDGSPMHLAAEGSAFVLVSARRIASGRLEIGTYTLELGQWTASAAPFLVDNDHRLDVAVGGGVAFMANLADMRARVYGLGGQLTWSAPHGSWREPLRLFPRAGLVLRRDEASPLEVHAVDFNVGGPTNPAIPPWEGPGCYASGWPGPRPDFDLVRAGDDVYLLSSCAGETRLERRDARTGQVRADAVWPGSLETPARLDRDAAGRLAVVSWPSGAAGPSVRLLEPDTLAEVRAPLVLEGVLSAESRQKGHLQIAADPSVPGRLTVAWFLVRGHGAGDIEVARVDLCPES